MSRGPTATRRRHHPGRRLGAAVLLLGMLAPFAAGSASRRHELTAASVTLVVRDGGHVEVRLQVPWAEVLRRAWRPDADRAAFLGEVAAMPAAEFAGRVAVVERALAQEARIAGDEATGVAPTGWRWPAPEALREALKRELMSRLALGADFEHASRLPATADARLARSPRAVRVRLSPLLGPTLVTVVQPREQWVAPGAWSAPTVVRTPD